MLNRVIKKIVMDHHTILFMGLMFILMGLISLSENLFNEVLGIKIEVAHGAILLGIFNVIMAFVFILVGTQSVENALESQTFQNHEELEKRVKELEDRLSKIEK